MDIATILAVVTLLTGVLLLVFAVIFIIKPQTHFVINTTPNKSIEDIKEYEKTLTHKKIKQIRIMWVGIGIFGIVFIILPFIL